MAAKRPTAAFTTSLLLITARLFAGEPAVDHLGDRQDLIVYSTQAWGELGVNTCAYAPGQKPQPLRIAGKDYARGLGHHASGEIIIELGGAYERFDAEVGVQPLPGDAGPAVFRVWVDGEVRFDSGVMKSSQPAKAVSVPLTGSTELRLEVTDAGDGITCDCANWAEARLTRGAGPLPPKAEVRHLDIAPFARTTVSDPARMEGARSSRTEEYRTEDVFIDSDLAPAASGAYAVPFVKDGPGVIGLTWLERRMVRSVGLEFAEGGVPRDADGVQVQYWVGESAWQGRWVVIPAKIQANGDRWTAGLDGRGLPDWRKGTRRIRWVLPASAAPATVKRLEAVGTSPLEAVSLRLELDPSHAVTVAGAGGSIELAAYNGEWAEAVGVRFPGGVQWRPAEQNPLTIRLHAVRARPWRTERTVLHVRTKAGDFGVSVDDVLNRGAVYVKDFGLLVSPEGGNRDLTGYRRQIEGRKTLLQEVRERPDQTLAQAMARVHNPAQNLLPTMLSLACDNHKFVVERSGAVQFAAAQETADAMQLYPPKNLAAMRPQFGSGRNEGFSRRLEGGWLPMTVTEQREGGLVYRTRSCVLPMESAPLPDPGWLSARPVFITEYAIENTHTEPAAAAIRLAFVADVENNRPAELRRAGGRILVQSGERLLGVVHPGDDSLLTATMSGGELVLDGKVPGKATARLTLSLPGWPLKTDEHAQIVPVSEPAGRLAAYWERVLAPSAKIEVPDPLLADLIRASQVHCLIAARNEANGQRVAAWIASFSYGPLESEANSIIRGMDYLGHHEFARRAHDYFIHRYSPAGFLTTGYTLMGTGWQLWTLGQHYDLTQDDAWLKKVAPEVARVCAWIMKQRQKTQRLRPGGEKSPEYGLMPPGVMADWNAYAHHFCLNAYYCAALRAAAGALSKVGHPGTEAWARDAEEFRREILRAYDWTRARMPVYPLRDGTAVPGYPSQVHSPGPLGLFFPGEDGNRSWCYDVELGAHHLVPLGILDPSDRNVTWMMDHHEDVQFLADGWFDYPAERNQKDAFNLGGFAKVQPYYCRNAEVYALRDDVKPFIRSYFNTIPSLLNQENLSFQEHFNGVAAWNKTHETGYFLHQTRLMLVMERGSELWLAPFVTTTWMESGKGVSVTNAPTHFGAVSYRIVSHANDGRIEAEIEPPARNAPSAIVLRLRHPAGKALKAVEVNGAAHGNFDPAGSTVRLQPGRQKIRVAARY